MSVFATTTAAAREAALFFRRRTEDKLTPGTNFPRHERASFIPATLICQIPARVHAPRRVRRCSIDTPAVEANRCYDIFFLRKGKDALVGVAVITHRRVRPPVYASRAETCWNPAGMDGGRAGRDADAGGRGSFGVRFSLGHCCVCC